MAIGGIELSEASPQTDEALAGILWERRQAATGRLPEKPPEDAASRRGRRSHGWDLAPGKQIDSFVKITVAQRSIARLSLRPTSPGGSVALGATAGARERAARPIAATTPGMEEVEPRLERWPRAPLPRVARCRKFDSFVKITVAQRSLDKSIWHKLLITVAPDGYLRRRC